jgi:hypothetical protein
MGDDTTEPTDDERQAALTRALELLYQLHPLMGDLVIACHVALAVMLMVADRHGPAVEEQLHALIKPTRSRRKEDMREFFDTMKRHGVVSSDEEAARFIMSPEGDQARRRLGLRHLAPKSLLRGLNPSRRKPPRQKR